MDLSRLLITTRGAQTLAQPHFSPLMAMATASSTPATTSSGATNSTTVPAVEAVPAAAPLSPSRDHCCCSPSRCSAVRCSRRDSVARQRLVSGNRLPNKPLQRKLLLPACECLSSHRSHSCRVAQQHEHFLSQIRRVAAFEQ